MHYAKSCIYGFYRNLGLRLSNLYWMRQKSSTVKVKNVYGRAKTFHPIPFYG